MKGQFYFIAVYIIIGTLLTLITFTETVSTGTILTHYLGDDTLTKETHLIQEINTGIIASNGEQSFVNEMINATKELYASENLNLTLNITVNTSQGGICSPPGNPQTNGTNPSLSIDRDCLEIGDRMRITGKNWLPGELILITFTDENGFLVDWGIVFANQRGRFRARYTITNDYSEGIYYVNAFGFFSSAFRSVRFMVAEGGTGHINPSLCDYFYNCYSNCENIAYISYNLTSTVTQRVGNYTICWRE